MKPHLLLDALSACAFSKTLQNYCGVHAAAILGPCRLRRGKRPASCRLSSMVTHSTLSNKLSYEPSVPGTTALNGSCWRCSTNGAHEQICYPRSP
jgi:hypothetical protein